MVIIFSQQFIKIGMAKNKNPKEPKALKRNMACRFVGFRINLHIVSCSSTFYKGN